LGGVAVILTLLYLAAQIRQNTKATRNAAASARANDWRELNTPVWTNPEVAAFIAKLTEQKDLSGLSAPEMVRVGYYLNSMFASIQHTHGQWKEGLIDEADWEGTLSGLEAVFKMVPLTAFWWTNDGRRFFTPDFASFIDDFISTHLGLQVERVSEPDIIGRLQSETTND
jgi:hypothetical protein